MEKTKIVKISIGVVASIIIVVLLVAFYGKIKDKIKSRKNAKSLSNSIIDNELTFDLPQYETFATRLEKAMSGMGTDSEAIKDVFSQMKTRSDVLKLIAVFGYRDDENLTEWLNGEMLLDIDKYVNEPLKTNSVNYVF